MHNQSDTSFTQHHVIQIALLKTFNQLIILFCKYINDSLIACYLSCIHFIFSVLNNIKMNISVCKSLSTF
jgi:hypothetical protein